MPVETVGAKGNHEVRAHVADGQDDLVLEERRIDAVQRAVRVVQQDDFVEPKAFRRAVQFHAAHGAERDVLLASGRASAGFAARDAEHRHPRAFGRAARQGSAARQRLIVGVREDRQEPAAGEEAGSTRHGLAPAGTGARRTPSATSRSYTATYASTIRIAPKRAMLRSRTRRRSSANTPGRPAAIASSLSNTMPVTPSSTTSRTAPRSSAATGVPQAIASASTSPIGSPDCTG